MVLNRMAWSSKQQQKLEYPRAETNFGERFIYSFIII